MTILTLLGLVPILGGILTLAMPRRVAKVIGMVVAVCTLGLGATVLLAPTLNLTDLSVKLPWIKEIGAWYALDVDGLGAIMIGLTVVLVPVVLLSELFIGDNDELRETFNWGGRAFFGLVLILEGLALFCFMATDVLLFYIFFEVTLIPMYFLIGGWGGGNRAAAALKFLLFNLVGGLIMLFGVIGVYGFSKTAGIDSLALSDLVGMEISAGWEKILFIAFFVAFAIKAPMFPVHSWLPDVAAQARPGATALMVGVLDKLGTFGMIRFCLNLFPNASQWATPAVMVLAVVSILYGAFLAIGSSNLYRLVAFTSVSHFGFIVLGIFAFTTSSLSGSMVYMLAHGFSAAALFLIVGYLADRGGTAEIPAYGGVRKLAPLLAGFFLIAGLATLALPGFASFVGEYLVLAGVWQRSIAFAAVALLGTVLAAVYVLLAYQRVFTGEPTDEVAARVTHDLDLREKLAAGILLLLLLIFGFVPNVALSQAEPVATSVMKVLGVEDVAPIVEGGR